MSEAFIWDLDGILLDTYPHIAGAVAAVGRQFGLETTYEEALAGCKETTVGECLAVLAEKAGEPWEALFAAYKALEQDFPSPPALAGARECLEELKAMGCRHFVFTHKGPSSHAILAELGLAPFFEEVVTSEYGLPRKPDPAALNYLVDKYALDRAHTWYVGDRDLDAQCAKRAGLRTVLLTGPYLTEEPDLFIDSLEELPGKIGTCP